MVKHLLYKVLKTLIMNGMKIFCTDPTDFCLHDIALMAYSGNQKWQWCSVDGSEDFVPK